MTSHTLTLSGAELVHLEDILRRHHSRQSRMHEEHCGKHPPWTESDFGIPQADNLIRKVEALQ